MKGNVMEKPYVISAELDLDSPDMNQLLRKGVIDSSRESLDSDLKAVGKNPVWVPSTALRRGMRRNVTTSSLPLISLDDRYLPKSSGSMGISRSVTRMLDDEGYAPRQGYMSIGYQLDKAAQLGSELQIADDVVFSGDMIVWLNEQLLRRSSKISRVVCGIAIGEGIKRLTEQGIDVDPIYVYDEVDDELCERDLFVVPGSGRRIIENSTNALYFDNRYGRPEQWASIPSDSAKDFCRNSLLRSRELLKPSVKMQQIGKFNGYNQTGDAASVLTERINEEER